jgi:MFS family permease
MGDSGFRRALAGSMAGAVIEWYDFAFYGALAATVFAKQFFPEPAAHTGVLLAFGTQAVGFIARPLGGIVFGHLGDKLGRKPMLVATYIILTRATAGISLLPYYASWGLAAPAALIVLRFVQGFALAVSSGPRSRWWPSSPRRGSGDAGPLSLIAADPREQLSRLLCSLCWVRRCPGRHSRRGAGGSRS